MKLIPELDELDNKLKTNTVEDIIKDHPEIDKIIRKIKEKLMHLIQEINVVIVAFVKFLTYNNGIKAIYKEEY